ncbi:hypothetical protein [Streptomyces gardneri]|uniref:hypothetical protein n=1 Tax=Streptomyces gardneri TaxID=66892 RepID=UPI0035E13510
MARVVASIGVDPSDHEMLSRIASLLGMSREATAARLLPGEEPARLASSAPAGRFPVPEEEPARSALPETGRHLQVPEEALQVLSPISTGMAAAERSWTEPALAEQPRHAPQQDAPHQTLLPPSSEAATLHLLLSRVVPEGPVDVGLLLERVCRGDVLSQLPREPVRTLRFGVQVLVDLGMGMQPFYRDQSELVTRIGSLAGRHSRDVKYFSGTPLHRSGPGAGWTWRAYEPPPPGARVLILSDFGLNEGGMASEHEDDWCEVVRLIRRAGCRPLALVPAPSAQWPPWLVALMPVLAWDRCTTTAHVYAALS